MQELKNILDIIPIVAVTAEEMCDAAAVVSLTLLDAGIITDKGYAAFDEGLSGLKASKNSISWCFALDRDNPITFTAAKNHHKGTKDVHPIITCEGIKVDQSLQGKPPFLEFDAAVEIYDENDEPISRWHFDMANKKPDQTFQDGPLVHMQYGGHIPDFRHLDHPLKIPRWLHAPMDVLLLCEVVSANFYNDTWQVFRDQPDWCEAISVSQRLCYSAYLRKLIGLYADKSTSVLHEMDASMWV